MKPTTPTPEEILEEYWQGFRAGSGLSYEPMSTKAKEYLTQAMEEYKNVSTKQLTEENKALKEEVKEFAEWTYKESWAYLNSEEGWTTEGFVNPHDAFKTTSELYQLFKESKQ